MTGEYKCTERSVITVQMYHYINVKITQVAELNVPLVYKLANYTVWSVHVSQNNSPVGKSLDFNVLSVLTWI